jgi:hypothetical protein
MQIRNGNLTTQIKTIDIQMMMIPDEKHRDKQIVWINCF